MSSAASPPTQRVYLDGAVTGETSDGLVLSHLGGDALDQWERVLRWHDRLTPLLTAFPEDEPAKSYALDDLWAFFRNCYDLTDWVARAGVKSQEDVYQFVDASEPMRICRDIANGIAHYRLSPQKQTTTNANWTTTTYYTYVGRGDEWREHAHRVFVKDQAARFDVTATHDLFQVADACVAAWRSFLDVGPGKRHAWGLRIKLP